MIPKHSKTLVASHPSCSFTDCRKLPWGSNSLRNKISYTWLFRCIVVYSLSETDLSLSFFTQFKIVLFCGTRLKLDNHRLDVEPVIHHVSSLFWYQSHVFLLSVYLPLKHSNLILLLLLFDKSVFYSQQWETQPNEKVVNSNLFKIHISPLFKSITREMW